MSSRAHLRLVNADRTYENGELVQSREWSRMPRDPRTFGAMLRELREERDALSRRCLYLTLGLLFAICVGGIFAVKYAVLMGWID